MRCVNDARCRLNDSVSNRLSFDIAHPIRRCVRSSKCKRWLVMNRLTDCRMCASTRAFAFVLSTCKHVSSVSTAQVVLLLASTYLKARFVNIKLAASLLASPTSSFSCFSLTCSLLFPSNLGMLSLFVLMKSVGASQMCSVGSGTWVITQGKEVKVWFLRYRMSHQGCV